MIKREQFLDSMGKPLTQSLFIELGYSEYSVYTLKDIDHEWNGKTYPSIKRLYLEMEDVTEYDFANACFLGWKHWQRLCDNKAIRLHVDEWREELEYKFRSRATKQMLELAAAGSYQASKWLVDRGWATRAAGRPSKAEINSQLKQDENLKNEYGADVIRLLQKQG